MIKNVIFDIGGVVVDYNPQEYLSRKFNDPELEQLLFGAIFGSEEWKLLDAGKITRALAEQRMIAAAGEYRYEAQMVLDDWRGMMTTKLDTVELITALRASGYHIYYLSNMSEEIYALFTQRRRFMQLFEGGIVSFAVKLTKPDPEIFNLLLKKYDLDPTQTAFVDDGRENIAAAQALGLTAIPFKDALDLRKMLEFLGVTVPAKLRHAPRPPRRKKPLLRWLRRKKKKELKAQPLPAEQNKSGAVFIDPLEESEEEADESEI